MAKIEIDSTTGRISEVSQDNNAWVTVVLIILAICYFCFADDKDVELTKKMDEACSAEQIAKTGTIKCKEAKDNLLNYIKTELPELKNNYQNNKSSLKQLTKDKELKCSESGLVEYGSEGCKEATEQLDRTNKYVTRTKAKIEKLEALKSKLTN